VNAAFAVHSTCEATQVVFSLGGGAIHGSSTKQKLNKRSSTEAALGVVNDVLT